MKWTLMKHLAQSRQGNHLIEMLLNVAADFFRQSRLWITADRSRPAPQARAKTRFLSLFRTREERDILPPRPPRWARWPAVHAGTRHGEYELPVADVIS
jgi:hypothetical protein